MTSVGVGNDVHFTLTLPKKVDCFVKGERKPRPVKECNQHYFFITANRVPVELYINGLLYSGGTLIKGGIRLKYKEGE